MKFKWGIVAILTVLFLFGTLYFIGIQKESGVESSRLNTSILNTEYALSSGNKLSIKQIDSLSAVYNLYFTSANAKITSITALTK